MNHAIVETEEKVNLALACKSFKDQTPAVVTDKWL